MPHFWDPDALPYVISWEAWATLVAVIGAVIVGLRQAGISDRQTRIMQGQADIAAMQAQTEKTRLRAELYDRRADIYFKIERYLLNTLESGGNVTSEVWNGLFESLSVAPYLLDGEAEQLAREIHSASASFRSHIISFDRAKDDVTRNMLTLLLNEDDDKLQELHQSLKENMKKHLALGLPDPAATQLPELTLSRSS